MEIYYGLDAEKKWTNTVATVGKYDGIHLGHQKILKTLVKEAEQCNGSSLVLTFDADRSPVFVQDRQVRKITPMHERIEIFRKLGIDTLVIMEFNPPFALMSPVDFIRNILVMQCGAKKIVVGPDFRFGKDRAGNTDTLKRLGFRLGFDVEVVPFVNLGEKRISSTEIRRLIWNKEWPTASRMLGREVAVGT